jgi:hypothetical protein
VALLPPELDLQRIWEVHRQAARQHQDGIEPAVVVAIAGVAADPEVGGAGDAARLVLGERRLGLGAWRDASPRRRRGAGRAQR